MHERDINETQETVRALAGLHARDLVNTTVQDEHSVASQSACVLAHEVLFVQVAKVTGARRNCDR
jgi:hypothetical protein